MASCGGLATRQLRRLPTGAQLAKLPHKLGLARPEALRDPAADVDKTETISALEAFHYAERKTADFYESQKRLATEHAVVEDAGEGKLAAAFPLVRMGANAAAASDPAKRPLLEKKEQLEQAIDKLKYEKAAIPADAYKKQLTQLLLELARTQEALEQ